MAGDLSEDEHQASAGEEASIRESLIFVNEFLAKIKKRQKALPADCKGQIENFRREFQELFVVPNDCKVEDESRKIKENLSSNSNDIDKGMEKLENNKSEKVLDNGVKVRKFINEGARPKKLVQPNQESPIETSTEEEYGDTDSYGSTSEYSKIRSYAKVPKSNCSDKYINSARASKKQSDNFDMKYLLKSLDNRKMAAQEKFDGQSGEELRDYLHKFENYCRINFRGDRNTWISELGRHLTGKTLQAFKSVRGVNDTYDMVTEKLIAWDQNMKDARKIKHRSNFNRAKYSVGESMYLYSIRLEKLFHLAYPNRSAEYSHTLQERFVSSLPSSMRDVMYNQLLQYELRDEKVPWKTYQKIACHNDARREKMNNNDEDSECYDDDEEVFINLSQKKKYRDASIQCSYEQNDSSNVGFRQQQQSGGFTHGRSGRNRYGQTASWSRRGNNGQHLVTAEPTVSSSGGSAPFNQRRNTVFNGNGFGRPRSNYTRGSFTCNYCKKVGHTENNCRLKLRLCYICDSPDHRFKFCPENPRSQHSQFDLGQSANENQGSDATNAHQGNC